MRTALTVLVLILTLSACASSDAADPGTPGPDTPIPVEPDGGIGDGAGQPDSTSSSSSTAEGADGEPIPIEGEGGIGDGTTGGVPETVPDFGVSSETDSDSVSPYTSCWEGPSGPGICSDGFDQAERTFTAADQLVVTFAEGTLTAESSATYTADPGTPSPERSPLPTVNENPGIWLVDISGLPDGDHAIHLSWDGDQGDAFAIFDVTIAR